MAASHDQSTATRLSNSHGVMKVIQRKSWVAKGDERISCLHNSVTEPAIGVDILALPAKSSWTRFLPKILTNLPKILTNLPKILTNLPKILTNLPKILPNLPKTCPRSCPRSCPRCQDYAGQFLAKILAKILPKIWQDLSLLARSWPPAKILLFLARTLPKNFLLGLFIYNYGSSTLGGPRGRTEGSPCRRKQML